FFLIRVPRGGRPSRAVQTIRSRQGGGGGRENRIGFRKRGVDEILGRLCLPARAPASAAPAAAGDARCFRGDVVHEASVTEFHCRTELDAPQGARIPCVMEAPLFFDLTGRGAILLTGKDRASFLHGLVTNDVKRLAP